MSAVIGTEPVRFAAGKPESRAVELLKFVADRIEWRSSILNPGPYFVQSVDEKRFTPPFELIVQGKKIPGGNVMAIRGLGLLFELFGFSRTGRTQQNKGVFLRKVLDRLRFFP